MAEDIDIIERHLSLPTAEPLEASFANKGINDNDLVESELKDLFINVFQDSLALKLFDANVLGAPHLGTFELVRRNVNADGLVLLPGSSEDEATRYLYRAWRARDNDGRGIHFLKTYLQMLFPNVCDVEQMMQSKYKPYPLDLYPASIHGGDADKFLTSRIEIILDWAVEMENFNRLMSVFRSVIPARLTPLFRVRLTLLLLVEALLDTELLLQKSFDMIVNSCGLVVTETPWRMWQLGQDARYTRLAFEPAQPSVISGQATIKLPNYATYPKNQIDGDWRVGQLTGGHYPPPTPRIDGGWKVGQKIGYQCDVQLNHCKIDTRLDFDKDLDGRVYRPSYLGQYGLTVNGQWFVGDNRISSFAALSSCSQISAEHAVESTYGYHVQLDYPFTPQRLGSVPQLNTWRSLDGRWRLGQIVHKSPFGFALRERWAFAETGDQGLVKDFHGYVNAGKYQLSPQASLDGHKLNGRWGVGGDHHALVLNGGWKVGATKWLTESAGLLESFSMLYVPQTLETVAADHFTITYPGGTRLARLPRLNAWHWIDGQWQVGGAETRVSFGFDMRDETIPVDGSAEVDKNLLIDVIDQHPKLSPQAKLSSLVTLSSQTTLNGGWQVGGSQSRVPLDGGWQLGGSIKHKLTINGGWKVGERYQSVYSAAVIEKSLALDVSTLLDGSIGISSGDNFTFIDESGQTLSYQLYTTDRLLISDNRMKLPLKPYGDLFLGMATVYLGAVDETSELAEDRDNVTVVAENDVYFAQFAADTRQLDGLTATVTYLALQ